jgi:ArsR family transcriptional regulator
MTALRSPFSSGFSDSDADDLAAVLKVLASPARLKVLSLLKSSGPMTGVELEACLPLAQPTVTHHLTVLASAGLINNRKEGVFVYRTLNTARVRELSRLLEPGWPK